MFERQGLAGGRGSPEELVKEVVVHIATCVFECTRLAFQRLHLTLAKLPILLLGREIFPSGFLIFSQLDLSDQN